MDDYSSLERPTTLCNIIIDSFAPSRAFHSITQEHIKKWQEGSVTAYERRSFDRTILRDAIEQTNWFIQPHRPDNVWFGEVQFNKRERPWVIIYEDGLPTKVPSTTLFHIAAQTSMDHLVGHLYEFYTQGDYSEESACRHQYSAAKTRDGSFWRIVSFSLPFIYVLHKEIPLSAYRK